MSDRNLLPGDGVVSSAAGRKVLSCFPFQGSITHEGRFVCAVLIKELESELRA